jgi:apolipoprotein D and lipocalin family protein
MRSRKTLIALLPAALLLMAAAPTHAPEPQKPVDLQHYAGQWFEVARLHNLLEENCINAQATYTPRPDGGYSVTQVCFHPDGKTKDYHADMKVLDPGMNAKFRLNFFPFVYKEYWVLDYARDNSWVVLGEPTGKYLWLFSRHSDLKTDKAALVDRAKALGYDISKLIYDKGA